MELNLFKVGIVRQDINSALQYDTGLLQDYTNIVEPVYTTPNENGDQVYYLPVDKSPVVYDTGAQITEPQTIDTDYSDQSTIPGGEPTPGYSTSTSTYIESYGRFLDSKGNELSAHWVWINTATGERYIEEISPRFHVWANSDINNIVLVANVTGYPDVIIKASALKPTNDIIFRKHNYTLYIAAVGALVLFATRRKKKVGKVTVADITPFLIIGGGVLAFSVVKKLLESLGIWESKDTKDLNELAIDPGNFWNPNYWRLINPNNNPWTYAITTDTAAQWATDLYNAFGIVNDNEEQAIAVFKRCRTKANASFLCDVFQRKYNEDCLTFLRGGWWPQDRLSDADVNVINKYVSNLPNY